MRSAPSPYSTYAHPCFDDGREYQNTRGFSYKLMRAVHVAVKSPERIIDLVIDDRCGSSFRPSKPSRQWQASTARLRNSALLDLSM